MTSRWLLPVRECGCCHLDVTVRSTYGAGGARAEAAQVLGRRPAQPLVGRADRLDGVCVGLWLADGASRLWKRPHGPTAIVASEQDTVTNGHSHDGDQAQRPGHPQEPPEPARERRESRIGSHFRPLGTSGTGLRKRMQLEYQDWARLQRKACKGPHTGGHKDRLVLGWRMCRV